MDFDTTFDKLQMKPSFKHARTKKGDAFRKQKARLSVKEVPFDL